MLFSSSHNEPHPSGQGPPSRCGALESRPQRFTVLGLIQPIGLTVSRTALGGRAGARVSDWGSGAPLLPSALLCVRGDEPITHTLTNTSTTSGKYFDCYWIKTGRCLVVIYCSILIQQKAKERKRKQRRGKKRLIALSLLQKIILKVEKGEGSGRTCQWPRCTPTNWNPLAVLAR